MEEEIKNIKKAVMIISEVLAFSEARSNKANYEIEGQFMRQVETFIKIIKNTLEPNNQE